MEFIRSLLFYSSNKVQYRTLCSYHWRQGFQNTTILPLRMKFEYNPDLLDHPFVLIAPWTLSGVHTTVSVGWRGKISRRSHSYCRLIFCCFIYKCLIASMKNVSMRSDDNKSISAIQRRNIKQKIDDAAWFNCKKDPPGESQVLHYFCYFFLFFFKRE